MEALHAWQQSGLQEAHTLGAQRVRSAKRPLLRLMQQLFNVGLLSLKTLQHECLPCLSADTLAHQPSPAYAQQPP